MTKRCLLLWLQLLAFSRLCAQHIAGKVVNMETGQPIASVTLACRTALAFTAVDGHFTLSGVRWGDTVRVTCIGYKPYLLTLNILNISDTLLIRLEPSSIVLNQVSIKASRDYRADSLRNRKEFAKVFNYQAPGLKNIFINRANMAYTPDTYNTSQNNTNQLVSVNVLALVGLLGKNKAPESKLQKTLTRDEEAAYIDRIFSKQKVIEITAMKGDSLQNFMAAYRPTIQQARKMSSYDLIVYIKKSHAEFLKTYHPGVSPLKVPY